MPLSRTEQEAAELRRSRRLWRVPPGLLAIPSAPETLEGERILAEFPRASALLLWECYRDVRLWAGTPPELRRELFRRAAASQGRAELLESAVLDAATRRAVHALHEGVRGRAIEDDGSMATAALCVATTAARAGAAGTAVAFTQLAAVVAPTATAPALAVGRIALRLGYGRVAETWLRRVIALARGSRDWAAYGAALTGLGQLRESAGQLREARAEYEMAVRLAKRRALHETHGRAVSGLLRIALREEDGEAAELYARRALRLHGLENPARGSVLLDVAEVELGRGRYERAARLLHEALPSRSDAHEQVRALMMLVRAAGGAGNRPAVDDAWRRASTLIDTYGTCVEAVRLRLALARAGAEVQEEVHADAEAYRALACAAQLIGAQAEWEECNAFLARTRLPRAA